MQDFFHDITISDTEREVLAEEIKTKSFFALIREASDEAVPLDERVVRLKKLLRVELDSKARIDTMSRLYLKLSSLLIKQIDAQFLAVVPEVFNGKTVAARVAQILTRKNAHRNPTKGES